jgi:hypothetical protein
MADKMSGRAAQTASSVPKAIYHAPPTRRQGGRRYALWQVCYMQPLAPQTRVPCFDRTWTIWKHKEGRRRPPRRLFETVAYAQRPHPSLRPDLGGDRAAVANRPAPDAQAPREVIALSLIGGLVIGP